jgi:hypothetical protein
MDWRRLAPASLGAPFRHPLDAWAVSAVYSGLLSMRTTAVWSIAVHAGTVDAAEAVVMRVGHIAAEADQDDEQATALLRDLVQRLRAELRAGIRKQAEQR